MRVADWGDVLAELGRPEEALREYEEAGWWTSPDTLMSFSQGDAHLALGREPDAGACYRRALIPLHYGGMAYWERRNRQQRQQAQRDHEADIRLDIGDNPDDGRLYLELGKARDTRGLRSQAEAALRQASQLAPEDQDILHALEDLVSRIHGRA